MLSSTTMKMILHVTQYVGFFGAQITNTTLLLLLFTRAKRLFGSYRHVMAVFAFYSLVYTWIEVITQPIMHIQGSMFIVMMDGPIQFSIDVGNKITCLYCGSFALCIALLGAQFFYRYMAVCKYVICNSNTLTLIMGGPRDGKLPVGQDVLCLIRI
uniref:Uncharacterized protein n=1 Tax=Caenorhabditis japonica TaxID=281687 RepID=A0A8R1HI66_CAEJA